MVLAIYKSASYWKMSSGFKGFKLVEVLIRDQVVYFFVYVAPLLVFARIFNSQKVQSCFT